MDGAAGRARIAKDNSPYSFPKTSGKKQAQDIGRGPLCTKVPSQHPGYSPPHLAQAVQEAVEGKGN